ncbi:MAG TPA: hypothetical protein VLR52_02850 [Bacteroidales bacterium]|nr:hypothetical protein [Bacteroidales bacterium]
MKLKSRIVPTFPAILFFSIMMFSQPGCRNYNEVDLYPPCDTTNVTYSGDIHPIIAANCVPCHTSVNQLGGIVLDVVDSARIPARNGLLLKAVTHDPSVIPMPRGGAKLSDCDISKIRYWITLGEPAK